jgi:hypothetical protein
MITLGGGIAVDAHDAGVQMRHYCSCHIYFFVQPIPCLGGRRGQAWRVFHERNRAWRVFHERNVDFISRFHSVAGGMNRRSSEVGYQERKERGYVRLGCVEDMFSDHGPGREKKSGKHSSGRKNESGEHRPGREKKRSEHSPGRE